MLVRYLPACGCWGGGMSPSVFHFFEVSGYGLINNVEKIVTYVIKNVIITLISIIAEVYP